MARIQKHLLTAAVLAAAVALAAGIGAVALGASPHASHDPSHPLTNRELADALGNQHSGFVTTTVECVGHRGKLRWLGSYDHRCERTRYDGIFCAPGTGQSSEMVYLRVRGRHYRVIATPNVGKYVSCESVA
jgi:hypothetical protein